MASKLKTKGTVMTTYESKYRPNQGDYAILQKGTSKVIRSVKTVEDANNVIRTLEANAPSDKVGFGKWGVPSFLQKKLG